MIMDVTFEENEQELAADFGEVHEVGVGNPGGGIPIPETAEVGQTIVVKAVDENGKPTEWEAADIPNGWEVIATGQTTEEVTEIVINKDNSGNAFSLTDARLLLEVQGTSTNTNDRVAIVIRTNGNTAAKNAPLTVGTMIRSYDTYTEACKYEASAHKDVNHVWVSAVGSQSAMVNNRCRYADINSLYIYANGSGSVMGIGTKWELKGVRA